MIDALDLPRHIGAALLGASVAWPSYLVSCRFGADATTATRAAATWLLMASLQVVLFLLGAAAAQFALAPLLGVTVVLGLAVQWRWGRRAWPLARLDVVRALAAWRDLGWWRVAAVVAVLPVAVRVARALVSPPLAWDALTYHLPRAVEWVQHATFAPLPGPDAAVYYNHFAPYGEVYLAWALLAAHSDAWLFAVGAWTWSGVWIGSYALARALGAASTAAAASAFAGACLPAVASLVSASYVDNAALATLLIAATFAVRFLDAWRTDDAVAAGLGLGLLVGTKSGALPVAAVIVAALGVAAVRRRDARRAGRVVVAMLVAGLLAAPPLVRAFLDTGNPLFPLDVGLGPFGRLAGDPQLTGMMGSGTVDPGAVWRSLFSWAPWSAEYDHLGLGPSALAILLLAGRVLARRSRDTVPSWGLLVAIALAVVVPTCSPTVRALWAFWAPASPRLVVATVVVAAAVSARAHAAPLLWGLAATSGLLALPRGVSPAEWQALATAWPVAVVVAGGALLVWRLARAHRVAWALAVCGVVAMLVPAAVGPVRARLRMRVYQDAAQGVAFDLHRLALAEAGAWPLWQQLEHRPASRLALTAGFTGPGHNWYRYPLYGASLQHDVRYVPVTRDGRLRSYLDPDLEPASCRECWLARIDAAAIDALVVLPPVTFEAAWARALPERFTEVPGLGSATAFLVSRPPAP